MNRTERRNFFEAALENPTNIFMTIHGGPLSYSSQTASENMVGIVPQGCILVIITPPQAVVFSSPTEDTETFRFFQQKQSQFNKCLLKLSIVKIAAMRFKFRITS